MDETAPILLFDSGVGGLTVLAELRKLLPEAPVIYAADLAGLPYGEKTEAEIAARVAGLLGRMSERFRPRLITIACNTASTIALGMVREVLHVPIAGTHFPLVEDELRAALGDNVMFVDGAQGIARRIAYLTQGQAFLRTSADVAVVTGGLARAGPLAAALKRYGLERIEAL